MRVENPIEGGGGGADRRFKGMRYSCVWTELRGLQPIVYQWFNACLMLTGPTARSRI